MIDTTDPVAIERALTYCQGKSIINSINLEDGLEKFERVTPLARTYGAALVVGCIDEDKEQAQAITRERKLAIAQRSWKLLTEDYGIRAGDIIFDPLVFPCATGDQNYVGSARRDHRGHPPDQGSVAAREDSARHQQRLLRPARRRARGAELGLPLPLHEGRPRPRHRQRREARALRLHPGGRAQARRGPALEPRRRPDRRVRGALPRREVAREEGRVVAAARRAPRELHHRRHEGRPRRRPRTASARRRARWRSSTAR